VFRTVVLAVFVGLALPGSAVADPLRAQQWNLDMIEADAAHGTSTGAGAVVAVVDSGVAAGHPDLAGRLVAGRDVVEGDGTPDDGDGHGTHVAGIVGAATGNGVGGCGRPRTAGADPRAVGAADRGALRAAAAARTVVARLGRRARRAAPFRALVRVRLPGETRVRVRPVRVY
jgi:membrane-anchored mycosin MYCP